MLSQANLLASVGTVIYFLLTLELELTFQSATYFIMGYLPQAHIDEIPSSAPSTG